MDEQDAGGGRGDAGGRGDIGNRDDAAGWDTAGEPDDAAGWAGQRGVVRLPGGSLVRGRRVADVPSGPALAADFTLLLAEPPASALPAGTVRRLRWPDFWVPLDRADALDALREALQRSRSGERVDIACLGGRGRTGTALAALAILDGGLTVAQAVTWVRQVYDAKAVETPWQRRWLRGVR